MADSLPKIKEILKDEFNDYFLMIDEIDSFQLDSTFRMSMAKCLDIYKEHPSDKRALVTATPLAFSDPELQGENKVLLKYHTSQVRDINLEHCDEVKGRAIEIITTLLEMHPDEKIMVAYNSVDGCVEIASHLVSFEAQLKEDIKILCSVTTDSKNKAGDFFHELTTDVLPGRINLVTSAYFTGFDLHDSYHLAIISDSKNPIFLLSDKRIKQISGRCRHRLLSETVVFTTTPTEREAPTEEQMLQAAEIEKRALNCISSNYEDTPLLKTSISKVREYIIEHTSDNGAQFLRTNIYDEVVINFLSIDASTEAHHVKKFLYEDRDQLHNALIKEGHRIKFNSQPAAIKVSKVKIEDAEAELQISAIIERVINSSIAELNDELHDNHYLSYAEKDIIEAYLDHSPYLEHDSLITILRSYSTKNSRRFRNLNHAAFFFELPDSENYKSRVLMQFIKGNSYTRDELFEKWNLIFTETGLFMNRKAFTFTSVVQLTKLHFHTTKRRDGPKGTPLDIKIVDVNPYKFKLIKHRTQPIDKLKFNSNLS